MNLEELYKLIRRFEGFHARAYLCPAGVWTVGWGSTGPDIGPGTYWTREQADKRLEQDALKFVRRVLALSPNLANDDGALCAMADFAYNLGAGAYAGSTLRKKVREEDWDAVREQLMRWVKGGGRVLKGLVIRRQAEADLCP